MSRNATTTATISSGSTRGPSTGSRAARAEQSYSRVIIRLFVGRDGDGQINKLLRIVGGTATSTERTHCPARPLTGSHDKRHLFNNE